eukprot:1389380-Amphidinium_carterae.1
MMPGLSCKTMPGCEPETRQEFLRVYTTGMPPYAYNFESTEDCVGRSLPLISKCIFAFDSLICTSWAALTSVRR